MQFRATPLRVSIAGHELTVHAMPEGFRGPVRIGVGDEVRELGARFPHFSRPICAPTCVAQVLV